MISFFEEHNGLSWFITVVGAIGIFVISSFSFAPSGSGTSLLPVLYHIISFFAFAFFLLIALVRVKKRYGLLFFGFLIALSYGFLDEFHQFFVPGRSCAGFDVFLDGVGIVFALMIYMVVIQLRSQDKNL